MTESMTPTAQALAAEIDAYADDLLSDGDDAPSFYQIATGLHEVSVSLRTLAQLGGGREVVAKLTIFSDTSAVTARIHDFAHSLPAGTYDLYATPTEPAQAGRDGGCDGAC